MADQRNPLDWNAEDEYWRNNYKTRPYAGSSEYDNLRGGYRYGYESAHRYQDREWNDVESDLSQSWSSYEHRGTSTWDQVKNAVKDAWDRVTGNRHAGARH